MIEREQQAHTLGWFRAENADADPSGAHQHQLVDPNWMIQREARRDTATHRVAHDAGALDGQRVEERTNGVGRDEDVVAIERGLFAEAEPWLIEDQHPEVLGEDREVAAKVTPATDPGARPVEHQQHGPTARVVVVQPVRPRFDATTRGVEVEGSPIALTHAALLLCSRSERPLGPMYPL